MNSKGYLESYGWKEGEALRAGGLKKPILVKYKKDKKGLGCAPGQDDSEAWWERLFDGHLKGLEISSNGNNKGISFKQNEIVASAVSKESSPLYRSFVRGESLKGTIDNTNNIDSPQLVVFEERKRKRDKNGKEKQHKKHKRSDRQILEDAKKGLKKTKKSKSDKQKQKRKQTEGDRKTREKSKKKHRKDKPGKEKKSKADGKRLRKSPN